ncbi:glutathione peroxidase [Anditalea andensis]|uniref:Glutathione peroxidase n=1 Tax=Anditalea andensis TaxID=1048983 RepID=A0A074LJU1_9BACT|nr:glutathione peroxidase [Anditalea andensis]KEO74067.1 glutathione peroxidase [Anditalea andensis]
MNFKQKLLKKLYPVIMRASKSSGEKGRMISNDTKAKPIVPFHQLKVQQNDGRELDFKEFKGKKVLLVNTASNCGYTGQFEELQQLHEKLQDTIAIVGFPANDFKEQEKGSDNQISEFCKLNYGVTFPLSKKSSVVKGEQQNPIYRWLTDPKQNGWNRQQPDWNFSKYLIDENGVLTNYYGPAISPLDPLMLEDLRK